MILAFLAWFAYKQWSSSEKTRMGKYYLDALSNLEMAQQLVRYAAGINSEVLNYYIKSSQIALFQIFFSDKLLITMFGEAAIQYAEPASYPHYFKSKIENGLRRADKSSNYFLHHFFLGHYIDNQDTIPPYCLSQSKIEAFKMYHATINEIENLQDYDMINLSNILDWSSETEIQQCFAILVEKLKPGAVVLYRQLNNNNSYQALYESNFQLNEELGQELINEDRSLFYQKINVLKKVR